MTQLRSKQCRTNDAPCPLGSVLSFFPATGANSCSSSEVESGSQTTVAAVTAVTVDFFRKGSYSSALPATAPLLDSWHQRKPKLQSLRDAAIASSQEESSGREAASMGGLEKSAWAGGEGSDTEPGVCVLWLQVNTDVLFFFIFSRRTLSRSGTLCLHVAIDSWRAYSTGPIRRNWHSGPGYNFSY